jgi:tRNA threonylcarbamoyladenosine biosynthesis protein TsaE
VRFSLAHHGLASGATLHQQLIPDALIHDPATMLGEMKRIANTAEATRALGVEFVSNLKSTDVVALVGDLGAGKTEFVKGLAVGLGSPATVTSPTFTLIHQYMGGRLPLYHMDFYRLTAAVELDEIGFDDYLSEPGICAIEWANRFPERIPGAAIWVTLSITETNERLICW